jgi:uncharacterized HAD superfamily protein
MPLWRGGNQKTNIMIEYVKSVRTSDGEVHGSIEAAQNHELGNLLNIDADAVLQAMIQHGPEIVAILSFKGRKPRAKNGIGAKSKATKKAAINAVTQDTKPLVLP